jgi:hypothetical protein
VKLALDPGWGHYEFKGLARFFRDRVLTNGTATVAAPTALASQGNSNYSEGWGLGFGTILPVTKKVDFAFNGLAGAGIGTYCGSTSNDATLNYSDELVPIKAVCSTAGVELHPVPKFDINFYVAEEYFARTQYNTSATNAGRGGFGSIYAAPGTDNKTIQWAMASFVYRWYRGPYGTFQTLVEPQYFVRTTWASSLAGNAYAIDKGTAKGGDFVGIVSMRYILPGSHFCCRRLLPQSTVSRLLFEGPGRTSRRALAHNDAEHLADRGLPSHFRRFLSTVPQRREACEADEDRLIC